MYILFLKPLKHATPRGTEQLKAKYMYATISAVNWMIHEQEGSSFTVGEPLPRDSLWVKEAHVTPDSKEGMDCPVSYLLLQFE